MVEPLLVADDLDRNRLASLMVLAIQDLTERTLAERIHDLIAVSKMIAIDNEVVAALVVVPKVVGGEVGMSLFLLAACTDAVHLRIIDTLFVLVG
jgi:hypothetical protein